MNGAADNPLEAALKAAARDTARRPAFYELLLDSTVYVIGHTATPGTGQHTAQAGEKLAIQHWQTKEGTPVIPFFTSLPALQRVLKEQMGYLALEGRELFALTRGASLVLNPMSEHGKEFYPDEVAALLDGGVAHLGRMLDVPESRAIELDQPPDVPHDLIKALARFLPRHPAVRRAFLCRMKDPAAGDPAAGAAPSLLVGLEGDGDLADVIRKAGAVAADTAPAGMAVVFTAIHAGEKGPSEYMLAAVAPFYTRDKPGIFQRWFRRK